jgi:hypothetical protein
MKIQNSDSNWRKFGFGFATTKKLCDNGIHHHWTHKENKEETCTEIGPNAIPDLLI